MSFEAIQWAKQQTVGSAIAKAVLKALADLADATGFAYPGRQWLAIQCECSPRTVSRAFELLLSLGLIRRDRRASVRGHRLNDGYVLSLSATQSRDTSASPRCQSDITHKKKDPFIDRPKRPLVERSVRPAVRSSSLAKGPDLSTVEYISAYDEPELFRLLEKQRGGSVPRSRTNCFAFPKRDVDAHRKAMARRNVGQDDTRSERTESHADAPS
jgi:DNA-binding transcriptional regulator YhcF (GntR family)